MTLSALRVLLRRALSEAAERTGLEIDTSFEADEILRHCGGLSRSDVLLHGDRAADDALCSAALSIADGRKSGEPLAYLLGEVSFFSYDFSVRRGCLIPRADTEVVVEEACSLLPSGGVLWDLCTGSGCIPCAVLLSRDDVSAFGVELFPDALSVAEENRVRHGLRGRFFVTRGDVLAGAVPLSPENGLCAPLPAVISANPPYIASSVCETLDVQVRREPLSALDGGTDGLDFYRAILSRYARNLLPGGHFVFEIGYDQGDALRLLAHEHGFCARIRQDYAGHDRAVILSKAL